MHQLLLYYYFARLPCTHLNMAGVDMLYSGKPDNQLPLGMCS